MTAFEKWNKFRRRRNLCLSLAFSVGIIGLVGVALSVPEPNLDKISWGVKVGLGAYLIIFGLLLTFAIVYHRRMRNIVKSI